MSNKKPQVDTPYKGSWADQMSNGEGKKEALRLSIEKAKKAPAIFHNLNITWYMRLMNCSREQARQELGYPEPLATITAEEYRKMTWRPNATR